MCRDTSGCVEILVDREILVDGKRYWWMCRDTGGWVEILVDG